MADEDTAPEEEAAPKKGSKKLIIIIAAVALVVVLGGGVAAYFLVFAKPAEVQGGGEAGGKGAEKEGKGVTLGTTTQLDAFIVNLAGESNRYLKVVIVLQLSKAELSAELKNKAPQIKDSIITVLSSKAPEEILTIQGKHDLKVDLVRRINSNLTGGVVQEMFFTEFVVQ